MTAKEYLEQYRYAVNEVQRLTDLIAQMRDEATSVQAVSAGVGTKSSLPSDRVGNAASAIADKITELESAVAEQNKILSAIDCTISQLEDKRHREILRLYYINRKNFYSIAFFMNYSVRQIFNIYAAALAEVAKLIDN